MFLIINLLYFDYFFLFSISYFGKYIILHFLSSFFRINFKLKIILKRFLIKSLHCKKTITMNIFENDFIFLQHEKILFKVV